jgi:uncharacterized protein
VVAAGPAANRECAAISPATCWASTSQGACPPGITKSRAPGIRKPVKFAGTHFPPGGEVIDHGVVMTGTWTAAMEGGLAGLMVAIVTTPAGVSGAVFLLPIQLSILNVPSPAITPTNLLFNVVAVPGALLRYRRSGKLSSPLTRQFIRGTLPGVVAGAVIRIYLVPGPRVFRAIVAVLLLPLGAWLATQTIRKTAPDAQTLPSGRFVSLLALAVGVAGGIYGIGGGSILGPVIAGRGVPVTEVAPAALTSTFVTSLAGAVTYALLSLTTAGHIAPDWPLGLSCGLGGLIGGYLGAWLQPRLSEPILRLLLAALAIGLGGLYLAQTLS